MILRESYYTGYSNPERNTADAAVWPVRILKNAK